MGTAPGSASFPAPSALTLTSVIFATDFSGTSEKAGRYAAAVARQFDAALLVAHAFVLSQAAMEAEAGHLGSKSAQREELEAALQLEAQRLGSGLRSSSEVLLEGEPREQIPQLAAQSEPSLIVLGTQGRGSVGHALLGSTAEGILRSTGGPAITVGPHVPACCENDPPFRRVLYATGLSEQAARGAALAVGMAEAFGAQMDVLHVVHPEDMTHADKLAAVRTRFEAEVTAMVPHHAAAISAPHGVIATGSAHERILDYIREHAIDLLVLSLRKSSHLWLESRRSGAFQIIAEAACPVLTIVG